MDQLRIDAIVQQIDDSLGEELPFSARALTEQELGVLRHVFGDAGYQDYLDDQTNRQIIRVYLTNAAILGFLPENGLEAYAAQIGTIHGRAALALHFLMSSVEDAANLPLEPDPEPEQLTPLRPDAGSAPHLHVIRS